MIFDLLRKFAMCVPTFGVGSACVIDKSNAQHCCKLETCF
jgi:hypothetical protein